MQTAPNSLVLWTTRLDSAGRAKNLFPSVLTRGSTFPRDERHYATDEHGCRFLANYRSGSTVAGNAVMGVAFDAYPRTAKQLEYVICDSSDNVIGKLSVPNPFAAMPESKPWLPEKMPITKTNGGLVAELRKLRRLSSSGRILPETRLARLTDVELWEKGPSWISDSSGNRTLFGSLCTNEPAWKIETEFFRNARAEFRPDETWVITNVAVPRPGESIVLHKTNMLQSCVVAVTSLQGFALSEPDTSPEVRRNPPDADTTEISVKPPTLHVWSTHWNNEIRILIRARDDSGRKLVTRAHEERAMGSSRHAAQWQQGFDVHPFPNSKSLDIEVLVQKPAKFEFFVEPSQATDRTAQW